MPSHKSYSEGSHGTCHRRKPWEAKVQLERKTYWLGSFQTCDEAKDAEEAFKWGLVQITNEAHAMWRERAEFLLKVAKVRENARA